MTSFSKFLLGKKLSMLNHSQESIETLSLWILHYRKYASTIIKYWANEFFTASEKQKIAFLFLANEVIKTSKNKTQVFQEEFKKVLPEIFQHIGKNFTKCELIEQAHRILDIWRSHELFSSKEVEEFCSSLNDDSLTSTIEKENYELDAEEPSEIKRVILVFKAPTSKELIHALDSLDDLSSANNHTRIKIDVFPKKLFETKAIYTLKNSKEAEEYAENLEKAQKLTERYNELLEEELKERKQLQELLAGFKEAELERIAGIEKKLEDVKNDLQENINLRVELERHRESLPDLDQFSNTTKLPPLPNVIDLFKK